MQKNLEKSRPDQTPVRSAAHHNHGKGISMPSVLPYRLPVQFTLEDAQRKWGQWYKNNQVDRNTIERYIAAKKRGWLILKRELERAPPDPENAPAMNVDVLPDPDAMQEDAQHIDPQIHPEDDEMHANIIGKQFTDVSDSATKLETDSRKYNSVKAFAEQNVDQSDPLHGPLSIFYKKNAPAGYNTSMPDDDQHDEYVYDVRNDRDFTFGLPATPISARRIHTDYFRAPFNHKHTLRTQHDNQLRKHLKKTYSDKAKQIASKQVYLSFNVEQVAPNKLAVKAMDTSYTNFNMLGSKSGATLLQHKVSIGDVDLVMWINKDSAGHQSRYNASAIVPNLVQYQLIFDALKIKPEIQWEPTGEIEEKEFHASTKKAVLENKQGALPSLNYKEEMLNDRRELVTAVSNAINARVVKKYLRAITANQQQDFLQYPCLVLEPGENYARDFQVGDTKPMDTLKEHIVRGIHNNFDISLANRGTFGLAHPTVGDVAVSVRIWPGLMPGVSFSNIILQTLETIGLMGPAQHGPVVNPKNEKEPLVVALNLAIIRAQKRYERYEQFKDQNQSIAKKDIYRWVNNRITSNVIKAKQLTELLVKDPHDLEVMRRAVRTLENLNEYDQIQAGAEEQQHVKYPPQQGGDRRDILLDAFKQRSRNRVVPGWELVTEKICSSGMEAYRIALETTGNTHPESARLYFETAKVNREIAKPSTGLIRHGSITKMQDPSYNFVNEADVKTNTPYVWMKEGTLPSVQIYDITNTPISAAFGKVDPNQKPDMVIFFESLSKHFQLGMDKTTIGRLVVYVNPATKNDPQVQLLCFKFGMVRDAPFPNYFLNYMSLQNELFGE